MQKSGSEYALRIKNLSTYFFTRSGIVRAVDDVSLDLLQGETLCIVGESGCGKSVTAQSVLRIVMSPPGKIIGGAIEFGERDLLACSEREMQTLRGNQISMVFQEPLTSLDPVLRVGTQIGEVIRKHRRGVGRKEADKLAISQLSEVGIPEPERRVRCFPYELSGGMRQRVMIAMALSSGNLKLLIADEPTTALDVTIQAQILDLLQSIQNRTHMSMLFITHDFGVVAEVAHHVAVMYAGSVVEYADIKTVFREPLHPYTIGLMKCLPGVNQTVRSRALHYIPGHLPTSGEVVVGCKFKNRCDRARNICDDVAPALRSVSKAHLVRCHMVESTSVDG